MQFFRIESPFPSAYAIVTVVASGEASVGECFLLVENGGPFLGFRRLRLPGAATRETIAEAATKEAQRNHSKMCEAAQRHGRLAREAGPALDAQLVPATSADLAAVVAIRNFAEHVEWISGNTASTSLRDWLRAQAVASGIQSQSPRAKHEAAK